MFGKKTLRSVAKLGLLSLGLSVATSAMAEVGPPEKEDLKFGFIKLTDMAPIAIAFENGYFEEEGLFVTIEAQANWKVLLDGVISCLLYTSPSPRDKRQSRMPSSA